MKIKPGQINFVYDEFLEQYYPVFMNWEVLYEEGEVEVENPYSLFLTFAGKVLKKEYEAQ